MRLLLLSTILACACGAQTYTTTQVGSEIDCVTTPCSSNLENGDTLIFGAWDLAGSFSMNGVSGTGSVYGTYNDGADFPCDGVGTPYGNLVWIRLTAIDLLTPTNTTIASKNCMFSFKGNGAPQWAPAADGTCTVGFIGAGCNWKSQGSLSTDGKQYLQVNRQETGNFHGHDSTLIMSTDGGVTWTNPAHVGSSTNTNGDAPAGPGDATYPASIIWPDNSPFDGSTAYMARMQFVTYCRDNTVSCASVDNNSTYVYALAYDGQFLAYRVARGLRSTLANLVASSWSYYHCPGYDPVTNVCDGSNNANWDASVSNATAIMSGNSHGLLGGIIYSADLGAYVFTGGQGVCCSLQVSTAPHVWGPYTTSNTFTVVGYNFVAPVAASLTTVTPNSKVRLTISGTGYTHFQPGSLFFNTIEITKSGGAASGSVVSLSGKVSVKGNATIGIPVTGSAITVTVVSQSNTQAILSYTAPTTSACIVQASESALYAPLVKDVDPLKFTGADSDARDGNLGAGTTARIISVGRRAADLALDSSYYSRALQANTTHYVRINCGGILGSTSFTTANIPGGSTYPDLPASAAGAWTLPTVNQDSTTASIIDQFTGAYMKPLTTWSDRAGFSPQGFSLSDGGFIRPCTAGLQTSPVDGSVFVCQFLIEGPSAYMFYAIRPSDGFVRKLGKPNVSDAAPIVMGTDMCYIGTHTGSAVKYCYNGDWLTHDDIPTDAGTAYASVSSDTQLHSFDSGYDATLFSCISTGFWAPKGTSQQFDCNRIGGSGQDNYGWKVIYWGGTSGAVYGSGSCGTPSYGSSCPGIIAAFNPMTTSSVRFMGNHNAQPMQNVGTNPTVPIETINWHGLTGSTIGDSPWKTTLAAGPSMGATSISVATCPTNSFGADAFSPGCWATGGGDSIHIAGDTANYLTTSASGGGPYTLNLSSGLVNSYSSGTSVDLSGNATNFSGHNSGWRLTYWNYQSDPSGASLIRDNWIDAGGHYDNGVFGRVSEAGNGWDAWLGDISTGLNTAPTVTGADSPTFHGLIGYCFSSICNKHPTTHQTVLTPSGIERNLFSDGLTFNGGSQQFGKNCSGGAPFNCDPATTSGGNIYLYKGSNTNPYDAQYAANKTVLWRKVRPTIAISGSIPYKDVSGPGSTIATGAGGNWTYCVAYLAGECVGGSAAGDIYFNPGATLTKLWCTGGDQPGPTVSDICIAPMPTYGRALVPELYAGASTATEFARRSRVLSGGFNGIRAQPNYPFSKVLPDSSWYMIQNGGYAPLDSSHNCNTVQNGFCNIWLLKKPPFPAQDAYDRSDFIAINTGAIAGGGSVTNAIVQFGYLEFGTTSQFYCTSRAESCYANSATIPAGANPFSYPVDGSSNTLATLTGVSCASGCNIDIPAISGHTLYYRVITRDSGNSAVTTGALQAVIVP